VKRCVHRDSKNRPSAAELHRVLTDRRLVEEYPPFENLHLHDSMDDDGKVEQHDKVFLSPDAPRNPPPAFTSRPLTRETQLSLNMVTSSLPPNYTSRPQTLNHNTAPFVSGTVKNFMEVKPKAAECKFDVHCKNPKCAFAHPRGTLKNPLKSADPPRSASASKESKEIQPVWTAKSCPNKLTCCKFSDDGQTLACCSADGVKFFLKRTALNLSDSIIFDVLQDLKPFNVASESVITSVCFGPGGDLFCVDGKSHSVKLCRSTSSLFVDYKWDTMEFVGHTKTINAVSVFSNGAFLASCSNDRTVRIWDTANCRELCRIMHESEVTSVDVWRHPSSTVADGFTKISIAIGGRNGSFLLLNDNVVWTFETGGKAISCIRFSKDGLLACGDIDGKVYFLDKILEAKDIQHLNNVHVDNLEAKKCTACKKHVLRTAWEHACRHHGIWGHGVYDEDANLWRCCNKFGRDAAGCREGKHVSASSAHFTRSFQAHNARARVTGLGFDSSGRCVISAGFDGDIKLLRTEGEQLLGQHHGNPVHSLDVCQGLVVSAGQANGAHILQVWNGNLQKKSRRVHNGRETGEIHMSSATG